MTPEFFGIGGAGGLSEGMEVLSSQGMVVGVTVSGFVLAKLRAGSR